jgi:hypothetical protein
MLKHERPVLMVEVLVESDAVRCTRQYAFKGGLAHGKRIAPHVIPVEFDQIEGPHKHVPIVPAVSNTVERGDAVIPTRDGFPVDNAGALA